MKRLVFWISAVLFLGVPLLLAGAAYLCLQDAPLVVRTAEFTPEHVERARRVLEKHDPRRMKTGALRSISISGEDLDLAANYLANRYGRGSSRIVLQPGVLTVAASVELPDSPFGRFVNIEAALRETATLPVFEQLRVGSLPVPGWLGDLALAHAMQRLGATEEHQIAADTIRNVSFADGTVRVVYEWREDLPDRLRTTLISQPDRERLKLYHDRLAQIVAESATPLSLAELLAPLMRLASERSATGDPRAESRAVIAVVAFYVNGKGLTAIVPDAKSWPRPAPRKVTLNGRQDFPQHFTISAAIAAHAGGPLSDAIGLYKEVDDSRGGSGFSFNDIAADRAGTVFGQIATRAGARAFQQRIAAGLTEADMMPEVADLPEFMSEAEFKRRFGGIGAPAYDKMMQEIGRRVAACALYR